MFEKLVKKNLFNHLANISFGSIKVEFPDGKTVIFIGQNKGVIADIKINDWKSILHLFFKGDVGFADEYRNGSWTTNNLEHLLLFALHNEKILAMYGHGSFIFKQLSKILYFRQRNTLTGSKRNIQAHYDLGNSFYELWLDKTMTYSAAIFKHDDEELESAQINKYARLLDKIDKPSAKILEVGCGWGGFMASAHERGHFVKGITLSDEQYSFVNNKITTSNLTVALEDYRHQSGKYDVIVSIEMFEAVGEQYWNTYFAKLRDLINDDGKILIQMITIDDDVFDVYRKNADVIRTFIFPGGMLICEKELSRIVNKNGLQVKDIYRFGKDYAKTLRHWLSNFDNNLGNITAQGFDESFVRLWRFYLAFCSAGFEYGRINVVQLELTKL